MVLKHPLVATNVQATSCERIRYLRQLRAVTEISGVRKSAGKTSCTLRGCFPVRESLLHAAGRFPRRGKSPAHCRAVSRIGKVSRTLQHDFPQVFGPETTIAPPVDTLLKTIRN